MKPVRYSKRALKSLARHRNRAGAIVAKIEAYATDPPSQANNVKKLQGDPAIRLRVGDFRVIFEESAAEILVLDVGPRGGIYG